MPYKLLCVVGAALLHGKMGVDINVRKKDGSAWNVYAPSHVEDIETEIDRVINAGSPASNVQGSRAVAHNLHFDHIFRHPEKHHLLQPVLNGKIEGRRRSWLAVLINWLFTPTMFLNEL